MASNGWETAGPHPDGEKKLFAPATGASVQLKVQTGGKRMGEMRLYTKTPEGMWVGVLLDASGQLLGHGVGELKKDARVRMLAAAGMTN